MMFQHPPHPIFVHFTVALTLAGILFYFAGSIITYDKWKKDLLISSFWTMLLAATTTIFTLITGFLQFNSVAHDIGSHLAMVDHRNWALGTSAILFGIAIWSLLNTKKSTSSSIIFSLTLLVLLCVLSMTAYKGGTLVYQYGLGVKSNPELRRLKQNDVSQTHDNIFDMHEPELNHHR